MGPDVNITSTWYIYVDIRTWSVLVLRTQCCFGFGGTHLVLVPGVCSSHATLKLNDQSGNIVVSPFEGCGLASDATSLRFGTAACYCHRSQPLCLLTDLLCAYRPVQDEPVSSGSATHDRQVWPRHASDCWLSSLCQCFHVVFCVFHHVACALLVRCYVHNLCSTHGLSVPCGSALNCFWKSLPTRIIQCCPIL